MPHVGLETVRRLTGTELTAAFNPGFLREGIDAVTSESVALDTMLATLAAVNQAAIARSTT